MIFNERLKMMKLKIFIAATLALLLNGCAAPSAEDLAKADYGSYPSNYEQIIKRHLDMVLKDPESAKVTFLKGPYTGWSGLGGRKFGYIVCADVNAKNSYGGYTGGKLSYFMIKNDAVIQYMFSDGNPITQGMIETGCGFR